jgi:hypothetical protein
LIAVASPSQSPPAVAAASTEGPRLDPAEVTVLPPVQVDAAVYRLDASVTDDTATAMAHDLLVALETVARATERGDVRLARLFLTPRELVRLREEQQNNPGVVRYGFDQLTIVVVRDSAGFQAGPRLAVRGTGTYADTNAPFDRTFMLVRQTDRYLLDGQVDTSDIRLD